MTQQRCIVVACGEVRSGSHSNHDYVTFTGHPTGLGTMGERMLLQVDIEKLPTSTQVALAGLSAQ